MVEIVAASADDVRAVARRRDLDDLSIRLSLQSAERGAVWAARDHGETIGVAVAHDSDDERLVGDWYVEPSYRGGGVGFSLLEAAFDGAGDATRAAMIDGSERTSLAVGLRFGLAPRATILRFAGAIPREEELAKMAAGDYRFEVAAIDAAVHRMALDELDRQTRGTTRPADHAQFMLTATANAFFLRGECVGYAYVWPDGRVGPLACASEGYLVQILAYALVTLTRAHAASWCTLLVPGSNRRIARASLRAGLRIEETFSLASDAAMADLSTYAGYHRFLF